MPNLIPNMDNVYVNFTCEDCGCIDCASVRWIIDNGTLICDDCGSDMVADSLEVKEI